MAFWKSIAYCGVFGGVGYVLMQMVTPDPKKMASKLSSNQPVEPRTIAEKKRQAIVDVLRGAAEGKKPMYRQTKEEIDLAREEFLAKNKPPR